MASKVSILKFIKRLFFAGTLLTAFACLFLFWSNQKIESQSQFTYSNVQNIPKNKVGLLLGTGKFIKNRWINKYYQYRIDATVKLFKAGKIDYVLISGDNSRKDYDEPTTMKEDLMKRGIPEKRIFLDYAGFRTLDSVVRCKNIFKQKEITIISQPFHNKRAIYLARHNDIEAIGFNAQEVSNRYGIKTQIREKFARAKVFVDLMFGVSPKFDGKGEHISIP